MKRALLLTATLAVAAGATSAGAEVLTIDPKRVTNFERPILIRPGETVASEISETDFRVMAGWNAEHLSFAGRADETVSVRARTDLPDFEVVVRGPGPGGKILTRGSAKDAALVATLPKDGNYYILVNSKGPGHVGKYLISLGAGDVPPPAQREASTVASPSSGAPGPVALRWVTAAPLAVQAAGQIGAAGFCTGKEPAAPSEMRHAIESGVLDSRLRDDLKAAGFTVVGGFTKTPHGAAPVSLSAEVRITSFLGCLSNWGIADFDTAFGKVAMAVDWVVRDRATGAELIRLTTQQSVDRKKDSGGLLYLTQDAFSANTKALLATPSVQAALRRPALAGSRPDDGPARDPLRMVVPPWRPTAFGARNLLDLPKVVDSDIDATDEDKASARETYKIKATAGETVSINVADAQRPLRVSVLDLQNTLLTDTFGASPSLKWKAPATGDYLILVTSAEKPRQTPYRMTVESDLRPKDPPKPVVETPKPVAAPAKTPVASGAAKSTPAPKSPTPPPLPKLTPPPGVLAAEVGKSINRPAGKVGAAVDLFVFIGEAGSVLQASAGAPGAGGHAITLYTPEGDQILTADGVDQTQLTAVLPKDGIYLLAVGRQNAAKPYKLSLKAEAPDIFQWSFRNLAGYDILAADGRLLYSTCWTAPGGTLSYSFASGIKGSLTVQRGGAGRWEFAGQAPRPFTTKLVAGVFVRTYDNPGESTPDTWTLEAPEPKTGPYRGYFCR